MVVRQLITGALLLTGHLPANAAAGFEGFATVDSCSPNIRPCGVEVESSAQLAPIHPADTTEFAADSTARLGGERSDDLFDTEFIDSSEPEQISEDLAASREMLDELATWKIDLNRATSEMLESIPGVSPIDAALILSVRTMRGRIRALSELESSGLDAATVAALAPYVVIERRKRIPVKAELLQRWSRRISELEGYIRDSTRTRYLGGPDALLTRMRLVVGDHLEVGVTLEKDAGEPMQVPLRLDLGHDYAAGFISLQDFGPVRRVVIGDFAVNVGEGLAFSQNTAIGSGPTAFRIREPVRPHSSSREFGFFRGIGVQTRSFLGLQAALLASRKRVDARYDSTNAEWIIRSNGLHRTDSERSRRNHAHEWVAGWMLAYHRGSIRLGAAGARTQRTVEDQSVEEVQNLTGYAAWNGSTFGVAAEFTPRGDGTAFSFSLGYRPARSAQCWIEVLRSTPGGRSPHSSTAVDSRGLGQKEFRWTSGVSLRPSPRWTATVTSRWRRKPAHPMEGDAIALSGTLGYNPAPWLAIRIRVADYRDEPVRTCADDDRIVRCSAVSRRRTVRVQLDYEHSRVLRHRFQIELSRGSNNPGSYRRGFVMYKDVRWQLAPALQIDGRILFFDVSDFVARIYAYENDLLYSFSAPVFSGRGRRSYILARFAPHHSLSIQAKYGVSVYEDVDRVGSGLDATTGPARKDVRIQIRWKIGDARPAAPEQVGPRIGGGPAGRQRLPLQSGERLASRLV